VSNDGLGLFDMNGITVGLYKSNDNANFNDDILVGDFTFDSSSTSHTFAGMEAGSYFYKVTGNVDGPRGGSCLLSSAILPAPAIGPGPCVNGLGEGPTNQWGVHDPGEVDGAGFGSLFFGTESSFPFGAVYTFSRVAPASLGAVAVSNDAPTAFDLNCQKVELFTDNGNLDFTGDMLIDSFTYRASLTTHIFNNLGAGKYYDLVSGRGEGSMGGSFLLSSALVQGTAPEPSTLALTLGSLVFGGWATRRRRVGQVRPFGAKRAFGPPCVSARGAIAPCSIGWMTSRSTRRLQGRQHHRRRDHRADLPARVGAGGVHQPMVLISNPLFRRGSCRPIRPSGRRARQRDPSSPSSCRQRGMSR
jgi:hypothetical protein